MNRDFEPAQEVRAVAHDIPMSPRKVRLLVNLIRGKSVPEALAMLQFLPQAAAVPVAKLVKSAASNAENNYNMNVNTLRIRTIYADDAKPLKRLKPRARGHADRMVKRACHITVMVSNQ